MPYFQVHILKKKICFLTLSSKLHLKAYLYVLSHVLILLHVLMYESTPRALPVLSALLFKDTF